MAEYIERRRLFNALADYWKIPLDWDGGIAQPCEDALAFIENAPEEDVAPVVHGRLVLRTVSDVTSTFMCSECGREFEVANTYFRTPTNYPNKNYPYCNCGARMDGE